MFLHCVSPSIFPGTKRGSIREMADFGDQQRYCGITERLACNRLFGECETGLPAGKSRVNSEISTETYRGMGKDAALKTTSPNRASADPMWKNAKWDAAWQQLFTEKDNNKAVFNAYHALLGAFAQALGLVIKRQTFKPSSEQ